MSGVTSVTAVPERREVLKHDATNFIGVEFAQNGGALFCEETTRSTEDFDFRAFDIAFDELRSGILGSVSVKRDSLDSNRVWADCAWNNMALAAVG